MDIFEELVRLRNLGQKCALATIVEVRGSIPSFESAKSLVREDGSMTGTIGGGCVEAEVWNAALEVIQSEKPKHLNFNLGQDAAYDNGLICGGQLDVFVEPIMPVPHAFIFGDRRRPGSPDGKGAGVSQGGNPAASRLAGKCVARETLTLLRNTLAPAAFRKVVWENADRIYRLSTG
jgi:xanthine/CO dehydrogenase XdhC/CoxF family maturation factor